MECGWCGCCLSGRARNIRRECCVGNIGDIFAVEKNIRIRVCLEDTFRWGGVGKGERYTKLITYNFGVHAY